MKHSLIISIADSIKSSSQTSRCIALDEQKLYEALPDRFSRTDFYAVAEQQGVSKTEGDSALKSMEGRLIYRNKSGCYCKNRA